MKNFKKVLALVLAVATLLSMATIASAKVTADYTDAKSVDYVEAVDVLSTMGVLDGYKDGSFKPDGTITRAEAAKIIAIFADYDPAVKDYYRAANKYSDVPAGNWAESYIAYATQTGIVAGVGGGKFDPKGTLTGVQFLKMALCTLGLDADKQGYKGSNWAVNVLNDAKTLKLTKGIAKFDAGADLTREQAAQIMLNVLKATTYKYGSQLALEVGSLAQYVAKNYEKVLEGIKKAEDVDDYISLISKLPAIILSTTSEDKAYATTQTYYDAWGEANGIKMDLDNTNDKWGRPGHTWTIDKTTLTYADTPVATYTQEVNACDMAADCGIAKTNTKDEFHVDMYYENGNETKFNQGAKHGTGKNCDLATVSAGNNYGVLIEVYENADGNFDVVRIDTYLAKVDGVKAGKTYKNGHASGSTASLTYIQKGYNDDIAKFVEVDNDTLKLEKGQFVLVNYNQADEKATVIDTDPDTVVGEFEKFNKTGDAIVISGKEYKVDYNWGWVDGITEAKNYKFILDQYGYVIGATNADDASTYAVITNSYYVYSKGDVTVEASILDFEGNEKDIVISSYYGYAFADYDDVEIGLRMLINNYDDEAQGGKGFNKVGIFQFVELDDGTYDAVICGEARNGGVDKPTVEFNPTKDFDLANATLTNEISVDKNTVFIAHYAEDDATELFTGYKAVKDLFVGSFDYIDADGDKIADYVVLFDCVSYDDVVKAYIVDVTWYGKKATFKAVTMDGTEIEADGDLYVEEKKVTDLVKSDWYVLYMNEDHDAIIDYSTTVGDSIKGASKIAVGANSDKVKFDDKEDDLFVAEDVVISVYDGGVDSFDTVADLIAELGEDGDYEGQSFDIYYTLNDGEVNQILLVPAVKK